MEIRIKFALGIDDIVLVLCKDKTPMSIAYSTPKENSIMLSGIYLNLITISILWVVYLRLQTLENFLQLRGNNEVWILLNKIKGMKYDTIEGVIDSTLKMVHT